MKTDIIIPEPLFDAVEELARRRGLSRNQLCENALAAYVRVQSATPKQLVEAQLNAVYATEESSLDASLVQMQACSVATDEW